MRKRIITGAILGVIMIFGLLFKLESALLICIIILVFSALEWKTLFIKQNSNFQNSSILFSFIIWLGLILLNYFGIIQIPEIAIQLIYLVQIIFLLVFIKLTFNSDASLLTIKTLYYIPYIFLPILILCLFIIQDFSANSKWIMCFIAMNWSNDVFAYFVGRKIGRTPLAITISPKKTREGAFGGLLGAILCGLLLNNYFLNEKMSIPFILILSILIWIFGTIGDLFESKLKRIIQVKDSGTLLPGHGGFLDRFDSFLFIIPIGIICIYLLQLIKL
ncbi:MAG: phosphatidate cytidylyltransferase [Saprospiraceae bacterium]|nr:phosphatidate cytidylyltransferase [Saprospiraceae bacterium]